MKIHFKLFKYYITAKMKPPLWLAAESSNDTGEI